MIFDSLTTYSIDQKSLTCPKSHLNLLNCKALYEIEMPIIKC